MRRHLVPIIFALLLLSSFPAVGQSSGSQENETTYYDPLDPFDFLGSDELHPTDDKDKSADDLVRDGVLLFQTEHLLDGRTKLLKALKKDPENIRAHYLLAGYYLSSVGHYRLALKYAKRAEDLLIQKHGLPPYSDPRTRLDHSTILTYISQIRLNLDNYQGALEVLDQYASFGYVDESLPGSRAWILMKLDRIQEAIRVARLGVLTDSEPGRTLNMLGILLSMNDQREEAIEVFKKAIAFEMSLGSKGQPATPLNNIGEVYRELFEDDKAEGSFMRAAGMKDGCEHFLPTLNLVLLYIEQMKYEGAASTIDAFQQCMAQFPLRNDEEYAALMKLARGRIDLHTGHIDRAIARFEAALEGTQWFGKIGTNQNDLQAGTNFSLAQALNRKNNLLATYRPASWGEWYEIKKEKVSNAARSWWHMRRARQILVDELRDIEDLTIRNTDSLLEYPTLGEALAGLNRTSLGRRLEQQRKDDPRGPAQIFYDLYLAQSSLGYWHRNEGLTLLDSVISKARPRYDELLRTEAMLQKMLYLDPDSDTYNDLAHKILLAAPAELRNFGLRFPVKLELSGATKALQATLLKGPFFHSNNPKAICSLRATSDTDGKHRIAFSCAAAGSKDRAVEDQDPNVVVNKISNSVFQEEIANGGNS